MSDLWVMFSRCGRTMPLRTVLRLCWKHPRKSWRFLYPSLVRLLTASPLCHVSVGDGDAVVTCTVRRVQVWPMLAFVTDFPNLAGAYRIAGTVAPDLGLSAGPPRLWAMIVNIATGGLMAPRSGCVEHVVCVLRSAGVHCPRVATAAALDRWLGSRYERITVS